MGGRIVIKLGGNLITDKRKQKALDIGAIESVSDVIADLAKAGLSIVIVHGAGSFGHILARKWKIADGANPAIIDHQIRAVEQIRSDMLELNAVIVGCLSRNGVASRSMPPSDWAKNTGEGFHGDISPFERAPSDPLPITFGDVVDSGQGDFGILSGDDLMLRLSTELSNVTHSIFLLGDAPGLMDRPPKQHGAELLDSWNAEIEIESEHNAEVDVTGGIRLKVDRAGEISKVVEHVWFLDGREPSRIVDLLQTGRTIGTRILPC